MQQVQHPSTLAFELLAGVPDVVADPYPHYRALREQAPVHRIELAGIAPVDALWVLARYDDCKAVLAHHDFGKDTERRRESRSLFGEELPEVDFDGPAPMLFLNPPDHTRIRGLVSGRSRPGGSRPSGPASTSSSPRCSTGSPRRAAPPAVSTSSTSSPSRCPSP